MSAVTNVTDKKKAKFFDALSQGSSVAAAAEEAGFSRRQAYRLRDADVEFAADWDAAVEAGTDALEQEAKRRALQGVDEPVFYQGAECGMVRKYSDTLLIFLLKGRRPEKFRERHEVEHKGRIDVTVKAEEMTDDELASIAAGRGSGTSA